MIDGYIEMSSCVCTYVYSQIIARISLCSDIMRYNYVAASIGPNL